MLFCFTLSILSKDIVLLMNYKIIFFANTLWFLEKFKFDLIEKLSNDNDVECLYLRNGPPNNEENIFKLKSKNVKIKRLNFFILFTLFFKQFFYKKESKIRILVFTLSPILISQLIFFKRKNLVVYVLEGLGRVFSSRKIVYRLYKRLLILIYRFIFHGAKAVVTLNYTDATIISKMKIAKLSNISIVPGTGFEISSSKINFFEKNYEPIYIDYVARLIDEKGFYSFVNAKKYINSHFPLIKNNYQFRIITPQSDMNTLGNIQINFLQNQGIILKPYLKDPFNYYKNTKVLVIPTDYAEGLSRILLESIVLGIPVLVSRNRGTEELLPYDYKYFLISQNPSTIARQLINLIENRDLCIKTINKQKDIILKEYSSKASISSFLKIIN